MKTLNLKTKILKKSLEMLKRLHSLKVIEMLKKYTRQWISKWCQIGRIIYNNFQNWDKVLTIEGSKETYSHDLAEVEVAGLT